jgi:Flp pilus assembly protein TadB
MKPAGTRLDAALARLAGTEAEPTPGTMTERRAFRYRLARRLRFAAPWLSVPLTDLALLGQEPDSWLASKITCGLIGLALPSLLYASGVLAHVRMQWAVPIAVCFGLGALFFFAPDLTTRVNAAEKRRDFRYALNSYLDLVALERGAGAGPTEVLEAAALIGDGWAFERIAMALDAARGAGRPPWVGLADLARDMGVEELATLADIAAMAGEEGGRVMDTLSALATSMHRESLAATRARAGARSTTMVVPIALLAIGFLLLLAFPVLYRSFHAGA